MDLLAFFPFFPLGLQSDPVSKGGSAFSINISKYSWNQSPASGAGTKLESDLHDSSYRTASSSDVPSPSPPGLTHTKASRSSVGVSEEGRMPKPASLMLHQWPHSRRPAGCAPERPVSTMKCEGKAASSRYGARAAWNLDSSQLGLGSV